METVTDFIFLAPKSLQMVTAAMKLRRLLLGRKAMTNLDSILKSRDIILSTKVCLVKVFPVVMYGCEIWTIKKLIAEELMLLNCGVEEDLESPLGCKEIKPVNPKGNQSLIFIGRTEAEAEASNTLVTWCEELTHWKDSDAGKDWRQKQKRVAEDEMVDGVTKSMDVSLNKLWETVKDRKGWCAVVHGVTKSRTWLSDWTTREAHCLDKVGTQIRWRRCLESWV